MKLPFRYQFVLAPSLIVVILAALVAYTLVELANINQANEVTRQWELVSDRSQSALADISRLEQIIHDLNSKQQLQEDDHFFNYLEQTRIVADDFSDTYLIGQLSSELRMQLRQSEKLLREPERVEPMTLGSALSELRPLLEKQQKLFAAQRRASYIDFHRSLLVIIARMSVVLPTVLLLCIVLAIGLGLRGLFIIRRRLAQLNENAQAACVSNWLPAIETTAPRDELDDLEICLANMTKRLLHVVSVENVLHGVENERRRIAMDMHDGVLADLTVINRKLDSIQDGSVEAAAIRAIRVEVDDIIGNLRRTIDDLHPQVLEILGLEPALRSLLDRYSAVSEFPQCHFEFAAEIDTVIPPPVKLSLFRILTEAINNVVKHAHGDRLEICLRLVAQQLIVNVEDNGVGMDSAANGTGHGCANMAERAQLLGATVQWRAARFSSGTCFELVLPLALVA